MSTAKKDFKLVSLPCILINKRFVIKVSSFETSKTDVDIMVNVLDTINNEFAIRFFTSEESAEMYINLLREAN